MNPFAGIYSDGKSTNDASMAEIEEASKKASDYFSTGAVLGNMDAQNTAQRGKMKSNALQEAHSEVMKSFLGNAPAFKVDAKTGGLLEKSVGIQGVKFTPKKTGPYVPSASYHTGTGDFIANEHGERPSPADDIVEKLNAGKMGNWFTTGNPNVGYSGVTNYFAPSEQAKQRNLELGGTSQGVYNPNLK
jgi:hypothetical protein